MLVRKGYGSYEEVIVETEAYSERWDKSSCNKVLVISEHPWADCITSEDYIVE